MRFRCRFGLARNDGMVPVFLENRRRYLAAQIAIYAGAVNKEIARDVFRSSEFN